MMDLKQSTSQWLQGSLGVVLLCAHLAATPALAQDDPPTRVARLAYTQGSVSFSPAGTQDWVAAPLNRPLTTGDSVWSDSDGQVELQLDASVVRLVNSTELTFLNLSDDVTQIQLSAGTAIVRVWRLADNRTYEVDTPNLAFSVLRPGVYRISIDPSGQATTIAVREGQGEVTGGGSAYAIAAGEEDVFSGTDLLSENPQPLAAQDAFDAWSAQRDARWNRASARYVAPDVVGYEDLDDYGDWQTTPDYGSVWFPTRVVGGWAPYHVGHWAYVPPWGYTWVDDQPWGFAPFHYGRWVFWNQRWGWVPAPRPANPEVYVAPVYAPALVAWVGIGAGVGWFALGPRDVFVPSYPVSRAYVENVNVSNTIVNRTVVTNVYNTTIVNNNVTHITYVNRGVPGAVAATTTQAFTTAQPISRNALHVDPRATATAQVRALAPTVVPTRQAVLGPTRPASAKPPAAIQSRPVIARRPPPPAPPALDQRLQAIRTNGGKPLSVTQARQLQPSTVRTQLVHVAPPATPVAHPQSRPATAGPVTGRPEHAPPSPPAARPAAPAPRPSPPATAAVHVSQLPPAPRPPSPGTANSMMEREQLQAQQQLQARQEAERQQAQQQQEQQHEQLARQQLADAQRQQQQAQLEQQHQRETQQLQQRQMQEQQQMSQRQLEQQQQMQQRQQQTQQQQQRRAQPAPNSKERNPKEER